MKSFCTTALALASVIAWANTSLAQVQPYNSMLMPWNGVPQSSGVLPVSYQSGAAGVPTPAAPLPAADAPSAPSPLEEALHAPCCEDWDIRCDACARNFYAIALGLVMTRDRAPATWLTDTVNDPFNLQLNTQNARADWTGGGQITLGLAWRGYGGPAVALTYWGLGPMSGSGIVTDATGNPATALSSKIDFGTTTVNGNLMNSFFDVSTQQGVWREDRVDNLEVNLQSELYTVGSFQIAGLVGFRYFKFAEDFTYGASSFGNTFADPTQSAYLNINCRNELYGGQVGSIITSTLTKRFNFFAVPVVGIYGNKMFNVAQVYEGDTISSPELLYTANKTSAAFLSQLDLGFNWAFRPCWRLTYGYRIVAVNNASLADNQFAAYGQVQQVGSLVLHGAFVGLTWAF